MNLTYQKKVLMFGFIGLIICGFGDWLLGYEPIGGEAIILGYIKTSVKDVPSWFYILSMAFGIISGFCCNAYAPLMTDILRKQDINDNSRMFKAFRCGISSAPMMFAAYHTVCCTGILFIQAALRSDVSVDLISRYFQMPFLVTLIPFTIWCFAVDIPVTVSFMYFVIKGKLKIPKVMCVFSPLGFSIITKLIAVVLVAAGLGHYIFLAGCGESWGWALMCIAFMRSLQNAALKEEEDPFPFHTNE